MALTVAGRAKVVAEIARLAEEVGAMGQYVANGVDLADLDMAVALAGAAYLLEVAAGQEPVVETDLAQVGWLYDHLGKFLAGEYGPPV